MKRGQLPQDWFFLHQHGCRFINLATVTSCQNSLYMWVCGWVLQNLSCRCVILENCTNLRHCKVYRTKNDLELSSTINKETK